MSDLTNKAIEKITKECENKDYLIPFEEYLTSICTSDNVAERILEEKKTLQGAFDKMKEIARKRQHGGCACIPPEEGFSIIREYYDIDLSKSAPGEKVIDIMDLL